MQKTSPKALPVDSGTADSVLEFDAVGQHLGAAAMQQARRDSQATEVVFASGRDFPIGRTPHDWSHRRVILSVQGHAPSDTETEFSPPVTG